MTKLEICNLSLDRLAIEPIKEDDFTKTATGKLCSRIFDHALQAIITTVEGYISTLYHIVFITRQDPNAVKVGSAERNMTFFTIVCTQYL
jgi:hypothetical protein